MPAEGYNFIAGAAGTGSAARGNIEAYTRWRFRQRALIDVSHIDTSVTILGRTIALPILFAPTALHRFAHPDAELATARAAEALGTTMVMSSGASVRFEDVGPTVTEAVVPAVLVHRPRADPRARRPRRGQRVRGHLRDGRHAGAGLARARGTAAAAAVPGHLVRQPARATPIRRSRWRPP